MENKNIGLMAWSNNGTIEIPIVDFGTEVMVLKIRIPDSQKSKVM